MLTRANPVSLRNARAARPSVRRFLQWRQRHGLSPSGAAEALGQWRRLIACYSNRKKKIPRAILLACKDWEVDQAA
jgi:hypothetical protein